jgi:hypothetical protein
MEHMTTDELLQRWSDGSITADELRELTAKLAKPEHQSALLDDWLLESSLPDRLPGAVVAGLQESAMNHRIERIAPVRAKQWAGWLSWRPLTAAVAGIVFGMFCTSLVFAYVAPSLGKAFTLFHEGFERSPQLVHQALPTAVGQWSVDTGAVVGPVRGASPKEGGHMLRLEPKADDKFTRAHYVVNLRQIPAFSRSGPRQAQFRVSFRPALVGKTDRYVLRAATFSGGLAQIEPEWMKGGWAEVQDRALSYAAQGGGVSKGTEDWITMTLSINVPAEANLMVLSLWAASMEEKREDRGAHYVDDVTLSFPTSEPLP